MAPTPLSLLLGVLVTCMVITGSAAFKFPNSTETTCKFLRQVNAKCRVKIQTADMPLFTDSKILESLQNCPAPGSTPRELNIAILTYVLLTQRCGVLVKNVTKFDVPEDIIIEVVTKLLSWPRAIPTMNCQQARIFMNYMIQPKNLLKFLGYLDGIVSLLKSLGKAELAHIMTVLPSRLCALAEVNEIELLEPHQIAELTDLLRRKCDSGTVISQLTQCSWKDTPNHAIRAMAGTASGGQADPNTEVCIPEGVGRRCPIDTTCVALLCKLDIENRPCNSSCPQPEDAMCDSAGSEGNNKCLGMKDEYESVELPPAATATADDLNDYICCLIRRPNLARMYPHDVLCQLRRPDNLKGRNGQRCLQAFIEWRIKYAPLCRNCSSTSHVTALLSPKCQHNAVKLAPTTTEDVRTLVNASKGRNVLLKLFYNLYLNLDYELEEIVCMKEFMRAVNVDKFKKLGAVQLEPVLTTLAKCPEAPEAAKVLAILIKGGTCPFSIFENSGNSLLRIGAITNKCLQSLGIDEALKMCTILMKDKISRISAPKVAIICKILKTAPGQTTCILCKRKNAADGTMAPVSEEIQVDRCVALRQMTFSSLNLDQRRELGQCKTCKDEDDNTPSPDGTDLKWCDNRYKINMEDIQMVLGSFCKKIQMNCDELACFIRKAVAFYKQNQGNEDMAGAYSLLRYLAVFMPDSQPEGRPIIPECLLSPKVCPFIRRAFRDFVEKRQPSRGKRDACNTADIIREFSEADGRGSLPDILNTDDLNCLDAEDAYNLIRTYSLNLEDWTPDQAKILLNKVLPLLNRPDVSSLSSDELRELGLILVALTPEQLKSLKNVDEGTIRILGSSLLLTREQARSLVERFLQLMGKTLSQLTVDDLLDLQNLFAGFTAEETASIATNAIKEASSVLGSMPLCDKELVAAIITHLKSAYGQSDTWDESQLAEYRNLLGALSVEEWNAQGQTIIAHIRNHVWLYHVDENMYNSLDDSLKEVISAEQLSLIKSTAECNGLSAEEPIGDPNYNDNNNNGQTSGAREYSGGLFFILSCMIAVGITHILKFE